MEEDSQFSESPIGQFNENLSVRLDEESEKTPEVKEVETTPKERPVADEATSEKNEEPLAQEKKGKKNKRQKRRVLDPGEKLQQETAPEDKELSVLEIIEQMNNQNMHGRKARNLMNDDFEPKKKGKKGKKKCTVFNKYDKSTFQTTSNTSYFLVETPTDLPKRPVVFVCCPRTFKFQ